MERSLFRFIIQFSKRDQLLVVPLVLASMVVYYLSLDLPKTIINQAIQGVSFPSSDSVKHLFGFDLERIPYLFALSAAFLALIVAIGWLKFQINTMKGWMGERMLRRLRYALFDHILRFPLARFRRVKAAEMATMVKDEVEPLGGFIGEALITPLFLGGQALTAMFFIVYTVGGYLVIVGKLDIGALVAVIAAYKDLPTPVKELIDWDQQRLDVEIKYNQVVEQFSAEETAPAELQAPLEAPELPRDGRLKVSAITLHDDAGARVVDGVSFECALKEHIAIVGRPASGASELAQLLARLVMPTNGSIELGGIDLTRAPEAVTGRALAYVGAPAYLFPLSVRENIVYSLKHRPVRPAHYEDEVRRQREFELQEAARSGNSTLDVNAEWIDYAAAGVAGREELDARIAELLAVVDLEETIFELGLRGAADTRQNTTLAERVLAARTRMRDRLSSLGIQDWVERFDPHKYNRNATLGENLLFGTPVGR